MWGYSIAAASLGIKHKLVGDFQVEPTLVRVSVSVRVRVRVSWWVGDFQVEPNPNPNQVEPGALSDAAQLRSFDSRYYIFHYTYQFEYMMDGV